MVAPFIEALEANWFETKESLLSLSDEDWKQYKLPQAVFLKVKQKLASSDQIEQIQN